MHARNKRARAQEEDVHARENSALDQRGNGLAAPKVVTQCVQCTRSYTTTAIRSYDITSTACQVWQHLIRLSNHYAAC